MSPESLLRQFDAVADAPGGVQKLREMILQLAVRGKLVPQDPGDEPASVLLERIEAEKERLYEAGKFRRPKKLPPIGANEVPFEVPEGWGWVRFGAIIELTSGQHLTAAEYNDQAYGIPYLTGPADFGNVSPIASRWTHTRKAVAQWGDILLTVKGAGIGKVNVLDSDEAAISRQLMAIRPVQVHLGFVSLVTQAATDRFRAEQVGIAIPGIGRDDVLNLLIGLPPLAEQCRIVEKVGELMALCDELEERQRRRAEKRVNLNQSALHHLTTATDGAALYGHWRRIRDHFDLLYEVPEAVAELRQAILQLAVRGKLVPQDPADEPASMLLEKIEAEKERLYEAGEIRNLKKLPPIEPDEVPFAVPEGWEWVRVSTVGEVKLGRQRSPQHHAGTHMRPYLRVANVLEGRLELSDVKEMNFTPEEYEQYRLEPGDILLNEGQSYELVGRPALYMGEVAGACFQNTLIRFRAFFGLMPVYALVVFRAYLHNGRFRRNAQQTTNIAHLSAGRLSVIEFPLPPVAEQRRIVAKVDQLMALCDELEAKLTASRAKAEHLAAALVHHVSAA